MSTPPLRTPTLHPGDGDLDLLFHPSRAYERPADVLADPELSNDQRRAILSSWASDACAVESAPALRRAPFAHAPVTFDEVMDALLKLDHANAPQPGTMRRAWHDRPAASA